MLVWYYGSSMVVWFDDMFCFFCFSIIHWLTFSSLLEITLSIYMIEWLVNLSFILSIDMCFDSVSFGFCLLSTYIYIYIDTQTHILWCNKVTEWANEEDDEINKTHEPPYQFIHWLYENNTELASYIILVDYMNTEVVYKWESRFHSTFINSQLPLQSYNRNQPTYIGNSATATHTDRRWREGRGTLLTYVLYLHKEHKYIENKWKEGGNMLRTPTREYYQNISKSVHHIYNIYIIYEDLLASKQTNS
jgi:hypothetical protein